MFGDPALGGGIRLVSDMFGSYLKSENKNIELLLEYAKQLGNGAVFKRLGFMLERFAPQEKDAIAKCLADLTKGNTKLDATLAADKLITRWRLWIPESWSKNK